MAHKIGPFILKRDKRTIKIINRNISLSFPDMPESECKILRDKRLAQMMQILFEMSHVWIKKEETLYSYLQPTYDNSIFESEIKNNSSVIVLIPHIGNWEMMNVYLSQFRILTAMYQPFKTPIINRFILKSRERLGSVLVPTNSKGITEIVKTLKKGGMTAFLPDQVSDKRVSGAFAPLFGHQAYTPSLSHKLALKTEAKVFIGCAFQCGKGFSVKIEPICEEYYSHDPEIAAKCLNQAIEKLTFEYPAQNQWEYKRYRIQPNQQKSLYKI